MPVILLEKARIGAVRTSRSRRFTGQLTATADRAREAAVSCPFQARFGIQLVAGRRLPGASPASRSSGSSPRLRSSALLIDGDARRRSPFAVRRHHRPPASPSSGSTAATPASAAPESRKSEHRRTPGDLRQGARVVTITGEEPTSRSPSRAGARHIAACRAHGHHRREANSTRRRRPAEHRPGDAQRERRDRRRGRRGPHGRHRAGVGRRRDPPRQPLRPRSAATPRLKHVVVSLGGDVVRVNPSAHLDGRARTSNSSASTSPTPASTSSSAST